MMGSVQLMDIQFSTPTTTSTGALQYTLTLDSEMPNLAREAFTVVFDGTVDGQYRVDYIVPDGAFRLTGTGTTRTFLAIPPHSLSLIHI